MTQLRKAVLTGRGYPTGRPPAILSGERELLVISTYPLSGKFEVCRDRRGDGAH